MKMSPIMKNTIISFDSAELDKIKKPVSRRNSLLKKSCKSFFDININSIPKLKERNANAIR